MASVTPRALIFAQVAMEAFRLAPGGEAIVFGRRHVADELTYHAHLWLVPWRGGRPRQLTRGAVRDSSPAVSPDGSRLAFVRTPVGGTDGSQVGQAWILPLEGGEPWPLTTLEHGVGSVAWSPDGRRLALVAPGGETRFDVGVRPGKAPTARRIRRLDFRDDESGFLERRSHLWVIAPRPGARPRQLTSGDYDVTDPAWSPDGRRIAFASDHGPDANISPRLQIWAVAADGGPVRELVSMAGDAARPSWSPDGRRLAFIGTDLEDPPEECPPALWVLELGGGRRGPPRSLSDRLDRPVGEWAWCELNTAEELPGPAWLDDETLVAMVGTIGRNIPYRFSLDAEAAPLVDEAMRFAGAGVAVDPGSGRIAVSGALDGRASEVFAIEDGRPRPVTRHGSAWQRRFPQPRLEELTVDGPAGTIQVWLASPADAGRRRLPLIMAVHGGPTGAWAPGGTLDAILLAAHGYRVAMPNFRGSATFGYAWARALAGHWGEVDEADALAVIDALVERGLADPDRLGVMGLSYGGYLTNWLIGRTERFAAAVSENGVANQVSAWANSYFGVHYNRRGDLGDPLTDAGMRRLWRSSPLRNAAAIRTPLLILQAEEDRICPPADNEQLFTALRVLDREVEYVLYPEEHHEMKSYGRPDRRIDRMERHLAWFMRHLGRR